ncbi:MAG: PLP-dependent aminotransferase family protein [Gemmatimonadaceae bacterium]
MTSWVPKLDRRNGPLYLAIVNTLAADVANGRLRVGDRIPTHRALAARLGIDFTTVSRAYAEARRRGLVVGYPGRGTFVRELTSSRLQGGARHLVDLSLNVPAEPPGDDSTQEFARTLVALSADIRLGSLLQYHENQGAPSHREAGSVWITQRGLPTTPECTALCAGAHHAITSTLGALGAPGRVVLGEALTFPGLKALAHFLGARLVGVPLDEHGLRPDALAQACRAHQPVALCMVPTLQNPTASVMPEERRREIAGVAREYGLAIIEDDTYGVLPAEAPPSVSSLAPELSYYIATLSKCVTPGLRIAYVRAPDERAATRVADATRATMWMISPLLAEIASRWIRDGTAGRIVQARRKEAAARHRVATRELGSWLTRSHRHGYHAWLELPAGWLPSGFVNEARRRGVVVTPSEAFAVDAAFAEPGVRVCLGQAATTMELTAGLRVLAGILDGAPDAGRAIL